MSDILYVLFFFDLLILFYLVFKYIKSLNGVLYAISTSNDVDIKNNSFFPSKLSLLGDLRFIVSLYTKSYKKKASEENLEYITAMDNARKYLIWQYPFAILAFSIPIAAAVFKQ